MKMQQYVGKCRCGNKLIMKITFVPKEEDPKKEVESWVIHGFCKMCENVFVQGLFFQKEKPVLDRDYTIDWSKRIK